MIRATLIILVLSYSCSLKDFESVSNQLERKCGKVSKNPDVMTFGKIRTELYAKGLLDFINWDNDTVFLIQLWDHESGQFFGRISNNVDTLSFRYFDGSFDFSGEELFTRYIVLLVENWMIDSLNSVSKNPNYQMEHERSIVAVRLIIHDSKLKFKCFKFREFYRFGKD